MKTYLRIFLTIYIFTLTTIEAAGQENRSYYHSFNSAPRLKNKPVTYQRNFQKRSHENPPYDSAYFYTWDSVTFDWFLSLKEFYKSYDNHNNLLCLIGKKKNEQGSWQNSYKCNSTYDSKDNVTSKIFYTWKSGDWEKFRTETYVYNAHNDIVSFTSSYLVGTKWSNENKNTFTYDSNYNLLTESYLLGDGNSWIPDYKYIYTYDGENNRLSETYQIGTDSDWKNAAKWDYVYDSSHNRLSEHYQNWDFSNNHFVNAAMFVYKYDTNNNNTEQIAQNWENETWVNSIKTSFTYDSKKNKTIELVERWNETNWENRLQTVLTFDKNNNNTSKLVKEFTEDQWVNSSLVKYTYDTKRKTGSIEQEWKNNSWVNRERFIFSYDSNGEPTLELSQKWDNENQWINAYYIFKAYNSQLIKTDESYKSWNIVSAKENDDEYPPFITGDSIHFYIQDGITTDIAQSGKDNNKDQLVVYPNPSNGQFNVSLGSQQKIQTIEIYDSKGNLILKQQQSNLVDIPGSTPGIYYIRLQQDATFYSERIVVQ